MRPSATLSIDLDNLWTYQRSFGVDSWKEFPSFLETALPRLLTFGSQMKLNVTAFVVGKDMERPGVEALIGELVEAGHEVGNHSYLHEADLHSRSLQEIHRELSMAESAIERVTNRRPIGFRGPAFSVSRNLQQVLLERKYLYDASSFPTTIGPIARSYQHMRGSLSAREKAEQRNLYGGFATAYGSLKPFLWRSGDESLLELPVSTMPLTRLPIHFTYINFLADISPMLARCYFKSSLALCRLRGVPPSLLLHATDFIGCDDDYEIAMMPGMKRAAQQKLKFLEELISHCGIGMELLTMSAFAEQLVAAGSLPEKALMPSPQP